MQSPGREPSMEDILASIKKVIAEEKETRAAPVREVPRTANDDPLSQEDAASDDADDDVLELTDTLPAADLGPPLLDEDAADVTRSALEQLHQVAATAPPLPPAVNPLEEVVRDMLRPILKQWLDEHLPRLVDEHVKREIARITGKPL